MSFLDKSDAMKKQKDSGDDINMSSDNLPTLENECY